MIIKLGINIQEIKRCKVADDKPIFYQECPGCGAMLGCHTNTLYYPKIGETYEYVLHCDECSKEYHGVMEITSIIVTLSASNDLVGYDD